MKTIQQPLSRLTALLALLIAALMFPAAMVATLERPTATPTTAVKLWKISYRSHDGKIRKAWVILPRWYDSLHNPALPLVISPHGRGCTGLGNAGYWGNLPGVGGFAVVNPDGMGRRLDLKSFGYEGQLDDLARMPSIVTHALPWVRIDRSRIYALGSSMGGQETLLLVARYPHLLAGAVAMDSVTNLIRRLAQMPPELRASAVSEVGGLPAQKRLAYEARSPLSQARRIATSGVPLEIWWSRKDRIVIDQAHQSQALVRRLQQLAPCAAVTAYSGRWAHSHEMRSTALLPIALEGLGLISTDKPLPDSVHVQVIGDSSAEV